MVIQELPSRSIELASEYEDVITFKNYMLDICGLNISFEMIREPSLSRFIEILV